ncbi:hypothetical protein JTE90_018617 [Oedothorax gibbosus]|uniref:DNA-repair protein Xrcc1 N-terminal domain-containing protein n=1 Tax=Oedothorax gibbosus TaxID=931172 RepID=A0AAV6UP61_9ARAC|nr:hypothetical protein JTE90_018617 [Oedothorax gibbosus]
MGVVKLVEVISCSSEDPTFPCKNMLRDLLNAANQGTKPWLCSRSNFSGRLEAEFQLERPSKIHFIDIGNFGSYTFEVLVGSSSFQEPTKYVSLLPMQTLSSSKNISNKGYYHGVFMYDKGDMNNIYVDKKWDMVKVILSQPDKKRVRFGLSFLCMRFKDKNWMSLDDDNKIKPMRIIEESEEEYLPNNSSVCKTTTNPVIISVISEQFRNDVSNFLIASKSEIPRPLKALMQEFELQLNRNLNATEKAFFQDQFKELNQKKPEEINKNRMNLLSGSWRFKEPSDFIQTDGSEPSTSTGITEGYYVMCPLCQEHYPRDEIEAHAADC